VKYTRQMLIPPDERHAAQLASVPRPDPKQPEDPWDDIDDDDKVPAGDPPTGEPPMELPSKREDPDEVTGTL